MRRNQNSFRPAATSSIGYPPLVHPWLLRHRTRKALLLAEQTMYIAYNIILWLKPYDFQSLACVLEIIFTNVRFETFYYFTRLFLKVYVCIIYIERESKFSKNQKSSIKYNIYIYELQIMTVSSIEETCTFLCDYMLCSLILRCAVLSFF